MVTHFNQADGMYARVANTKRKTCNWPDANGESAWLSDCKYGVFILDEIYFDTRSSTSIRHDACFQTLKAACLQIIYRLTYVYSHWRRNIVIIIVRKYYGLRMLLLLSVVAVSSDLQNVILFHTMPYEEDIKLDF